MTYACGARCRWWSLFFTCLVLISVATGCGGGNGAGNENAAGLSNTDSGLFLDCAVDGLAYQTATCSGVTDSQGFFAYTPCETVTFRLGDIVLGTANARGMITPMDLVPEAVNENHPAVINIARMLQSLDDDGQYDQVITIPAAVHDVLKGFSQIDFNQNADNFSSDPAVALIFEQLNQARVFGERTATLIDAQTAVLHFQGTLERHPVINVLSPNGGERLAPGDAVEITWQALSNITEVTILISKDGGQSWEVTPVSTNTANDGSFIWQPVPGDRPGTRYRIRIADANGATVAEMAASDSSITHDDSDADFSIYLNLGEIAQMIDDSQAEDSDGDFLPDDVEVLLGTDPNNRDSDHDGLFDYNEIFGGMSYNHNDAVADQDQDGLIAALDADENSDGRNDGLDVDSDGDGIPNYMEFYGYTYDWFSDSYALWDGVSYDITYFKTDPLQISTDQDPYSDTMETSGTLMDVLITSPGDLPMVPAYPNIMVRLEGYDVTLNADITYSEGGSLATEKNWSRETSVQHAFETGLNWETGVTAKIGKEPGAEFSAKVGGSLNFSLATGSTRSTGGSVTSGSNWEKAISSNPSEAARLKLKLKVYNIGTAAASYIVPTITLKIGGMSVLTFKPGTSINILEPGGVYPAQEGTYWVVDQTADGNPITLTLDELRALECGAPVNINMTQLNADVMLMTEGGQWESAGDWSQYIARCEAVCANIKLDAGEGDLVHHLVYADDTDTAPTVTLGDALSWIGDYDRNADDPLMTYKDGSGVTRQTALSDWHFIVDADTMLRNGIIPGEPIRDPDFDLTDLVLGPDSTILARAPRETAGATGPELYYAYYDIKESMVKVSAGDYNGIESAIFTDHCGREHPMTEVLPGSGMFVLDTSGLLDCQDTAAFEPLYADDEGLLLESVQVTSRDGLTTEPQYLMATYVPEREPEPISIVGVSIKPRAGTIDVTLDFDAYFPPSRVYYFHPGLDGEVHELTKHPMYWHADYWNHWTGDLPADWTVAADQMAGMWIVAEVDSVDCDIDLTSGEIQSSTCFASYIVEASDICAEGCDSGTLNLSGYWTNIVVGENANYHVVDINPDTAAGTCQTQVDYIQGDEIFWNGFDYDGKYDLAIEPDGLHMHLVAPHGFVEIVDTAFEDIDDTYIRTILSGAVFDAGTFYDFSMPTTLSSASEHPDQTWVLKAGPGGNVYIVVKVKSVSLTGYYTHIVHHADISYVVYDLDAAP